MQFIITGHGHFATGLLSSVKLITGMENMFKAIDFKESMSSEDINRALTELIDTTSEEKIIIFTDIAGGTPFNQSVLLKNEKRNIEVIAGTNLPILVEAVLSQESSEDAFVSKIIDSGKNSVKNYVMKQNTLSNIESDECI